MNGETRLRDALIVWAVRERPWLLEAREKDTQVRIVDAKLAVGGYSERDGQDLELEVRREWVRDGRVVTARTDDIYICQVYMLSDFLVELFTEIIEEES